jgi:hypothetical protein
MLCRCEVLITVVWRVLSSAIYSHEFRWLSRLQSVMSQERDLSTYVRHDFVSDYGSVSCAPSTSIYISLLAFLLRIWEVTGSNVSPEADYPGGLFMGFLCPRSDAWIGSRFRPRTLRFTSVSVHHSPIILSFNAIYSDLSRLLLIILYVKELFNK